MISTNTLSFSRFDRIVAAILAGIGLLTLLLIWRGDRVGLRPVVFFPGAGADGVSTQVAIRVTFNELLANVPEPPLSVEPPVSGTVQVENDTLTFRPATPLKPGITYKVTLGTGMTSTQGRQVLRPISWEFQTRQPRILYLHWDDGDHSQIFVTNIEGNAPRQLTQAAFGVLDFAVSPDGAAIAFTVLRQDGGGDLWLMAADGSSQRELLACPEAACGSPVWTPDGRRIIYERRNIPEPGAPPGAPRLWWLDPASGATVAVFQDSQLLGLGARMSNDGRWLSYVSPIDQGIQIYDLQSGRGLLVPSQVGSPAEWSPQGDTLIVPDIQLRGERWSIFLYAVDMTTEAAEVISGDGEVDDNNPVWSPDGEWIAFGRKQPRTPMGRQLWLMRPDGSDARALTEDADVHHGSFAWSPDGRYLLYQRYALVELNAEPGVWLLDLETGQNYEVTGQGMQPAWLP